MNRIVCLYLHGFRGPSCSVDSDLGAVAKPIIGGTSDTGDPSIVALMQTIGPEGIVRRGPVYCTSKSSLARICLTAAHCVDPQILTQGSGCSVSTQITFRSC